MEEELDYIEEGKVDWTKIKNDFYPQKISNRYKKVELFCST